MKILIVNTLYYPNGVGGAPRSVQFLAEALVKAGIDTIVVCIKPYAKTHTVNLNGVKVYYVGLKNIYWPSNIKGNFTFLKPLWHGLDSYNLLMVREFGHILDKENPDVVHTNTLIGFSVAIWHEVKIRHIPLIHTLRDHHLLCPRTTMFKNGCNCDSQCLDCRLYSYTKKLASSQVDIVVGISRYILDCHLNFGYFTKSEKQHIIFNSFNAQHIPTYQRRRNQNIQFGYIGQLLPTKGIEVILQILKRIPFKNWTLWLAGTGNDKYVRMLKDRYDLPNVHFMGFTQPEEFFTKIEVLLVPSLWHEPLGRIVIEAYAYGVPVIGSNRGGVPEIIDHGKTGFIFDPGNLESLEATIRLFIDNQNLSKRMHPAILEKAKNFLPGRIANKYLSVYKKMHETN
ncbi:glycosyltransferase family 4 protein [Candidatus Venteria ishoeyi]|uniref:Spore coat protein SA n=1 Tax=Candidatus Venteria ishoeyi TaxID=1899563 RepID=A0A1H6FFX9_9GAMM|nr:glycosyltransferase family 4 protein [Candidatus Venteria ishoeyi]SEH08553.1 Spore coat protein SA [Candidatus Venteria ishoeyi]